MKRLEVFLYLLGVAVFAAHVLGSNGWSAPDYCHYKDCPEFIVIPSNEAFEEREYVASRWITTKVPSSGFDDLKVAYYRLRDYCNGANEAGTTVSKDTWPGLVTITEGEDGVETEVHVSWFVSPGTVTPNPIDASLEVEHRPLATVYVRVFHSSMTRAHGLENMQQLREALRKAGKAFEPLRYTGAAYEAPFYFFTRHNEVWINAA